MCKMSSLSCWVTHQLDDKEVFAPLLGDLKVEKSSGSLPHGWQCCARGLFFHLHS